MTPDPSTDNVPLSVLLGHLKWHLQRFDEVLKNGETPYFRDAALQRFEFTLGSVAKCIHKALGENTETADSLEADLRQALQAGWLPQETDCGDILNSITLLEPASRKNHADEIFRKLSRYHAQFESLHSNLSRLEKAGS